MLVQNEGGRSVKRNMDHYNLEDIKIDRRKDSNERILDFIMNTKNPYAFKIKDKIVKIEFSKNGVKAEDALTKTIANLYK